MKEIHDVREWVDRLRAGTTDVRINNYEAMNVRERRERATYRGEYVDTIVDLIGPNTRLRILANDGGDRDSGEPTVFEIGPEGNRISDAERVESVTFPATITSDVSVLDYIDSLQ